MQASDQRNTAHGCKALDQRGTDGIREGYAVEKIGG